MKIKICGIKDVETARFAAQAGADFIGLVFHPASKRYVDFETAKKIVSALKEVEFVGVFVDHNAEEIACIARELSLNWVQLHGKSAKASLDKLPKDLHVIYALSVDATGQLISEDVPKNRVDFLLYDGLNPGSGEAFSWEHFEPIKNRPYFLSGGLNPFNVQEAIASCSPSGVDVSSGVENVASGRKDDGLIFAFIEAVRKVSA